jgi:diphthine-ammonia ligase
MKAVAAGHEVVALAHLRPRQDDCQERDSAMFQTVGWSNVSLLAEAMDLPLYVERTDMEAVETGRDYRPREGDEVEDLLRLLARAQAEARAEAVTAGAILSDYQRVRVESTCLRLGLTALAPLWRRNQAELLSEMVAVGIEAVLVKVACLGLSASHLGLTLAEAEPDLTRLAAKYGVNVCGEGGEYETFTLNCPLFRRRLAVADRKVITHSDDAFAPVCLLALELRLEGEPRTGSQAELLGEELMQRLGPGAQAAPLSSLPALTDAPSVPVVELEVPGEPKWREEADGWFAAWGLAGEAADAGEAVREAFRGLEAVLGMEGANLDMITKVYMYVDSMASYQAMNTAYVAHFGLNPPVRVCVGVARLPGGACVVLGAAGHRAGRATVLHVQGVSNWAPANIGPYSQGVLAAGRLHVSGQIGLVPGSMQLAQGAAAQAGLGLRHVVRVAAAMAPGLLWADVEEATCYVVEEEAAAQAAAQWLAVGGQGAVRYLRVPELPRGALVEWEVTYRQCSRAEEDPS